MTHRNGAIQASTSTPARRLIAAGIKRGPQPWLVEQPPMSAADKAAPAAASHVRPARTAAA